MFCAYAVKNGHLDTLLQCNTLENMAIPTVGIQNYGINNQRDLILCNVRYYRVELPIQIHNMPSSRSKNGK